MKIIVGLWHPAHVHTFKNIITKLQNKGHEIKVVAIKKDITLELLDLYDIEYEVIGKSSGNEFYNLFFNYIEITYKLYKISKRFEPDMYLSRGALPISHLSSLLDIPYVAFMDIDLKSFLNKLLIFDYVITPEDYNSTPNCDLHLKLPTYKELAYLHPKRFTPDESVLDDIGMDPNEKFSLIRFTGYEAWHDVGQYGIDHDLKIRLVKNLEKHGKVYVSSEKELPKELKGYRLDLSPEKIHDVMYYTDLFVTDSGTMAAETAVLGTPTVRCSSYVGENDLSNFIELEEKYGSIYNFKDVEKAIKKSVELIKEPKLKERWIKKRNRLLKDKIDLSSFLIWFIDNYPESVEKLKKNKDYYSKIVE